MLFRAQYRDGFVDDLRTDQRLAKLRIQSREVSFECVRHDLDQITAELDGRGHWFGVWCTRDVVV